MPFWIAVLFVLAGLFSLAGALLNWGWFMSHYKAAVIVRLIGRTGARVLYALIGLFLIGLGAAGAFGLIK
jgi:small neutral amino acid transporter SnatA (MarC family)